MTSLQSFPPVVQADCRLLILGSLPGAASLAAGRYYAHPRNRFWQLMGAVQAVDLEAMSYDQRLETLLAARVGLWDVIESAHRPGSLDADIRNAAGNDLPGLVQRLPDLRAVAFNGAKAHALGSHLLAGSPLAQVRLPSSSPANAGIPPAAKLEQWLALRPFLAAP